MAVTHPPALAETPVVTLGDVGSTNEEAMARLRAAGVPVWVVAARQLAGRGRRGRRWVSAPGNLYASLAFPSALSQSSFPMLPLAVAVSLADAIATTGASPSVKWPNDVLLDGRKTSGILIETEMTSSGDRRVVVGCGVNVAAAPAGMPATCLRDHAPGATVHGVFKALRASLAETIATLDGPGGVAAIRDRWLARAVGLGEPITVRLESETREGTFDGIDADGRLVLREGGGQTTRIAAGDVFLQAVS